MSYDFDEKISAYFDESLSGDEVNELADWIKADSANARQFARASMLHDRLQSEMSAMETASKAKKLVSFPTTWLAAAAALVFLLAIALLLNPGRNSEDFVTIVRADNTRLNVGDRLGEKSITMNSGTIRILFDSGVEVTIQGPADFELVGEERMILKSGILTANVPPGAEGFRVDTETVQVTDLGTSFGIYLGDDESSHVSVFDGEVEIKEPDSGTTKLLTEGEEVLVTSDRRLETVNLDPAPYEKLWPVSTGIESSSGSFQLAPPWPRRMPLLTSSDHIYVGIEGYRTRLEQPLAVNVSQPGLVSLPSDLTPAEVPAGLPLRSYILHYRPEETAPRRSPIRLTGTITFDHPVAGIIVSNEEFSAATGLFSNRKAGEMHPRRQLELTGDAKGDRVELSEDMKTLTVDLAGSLKAFDVIRVVVDASAPGK